MSGSEWVRNVFHNYLYTNKPCHDFHPSPLTFSILLLLLQDVSLSHHPLGTCFHHTAVGMSCLLACCGPDCNNGMFSVAGMPLSLDCKAFFGYSGENRRPIIYWMKGEKFVEELAGHIKESEVR